MAGLRSGCVTNGLYDNEEQVIIISRHKVCVNPSSKSVATYCITSYVILFDVKIHVEINL